MASTSGQSKSRKSPAAVKRKRPDRSVIEAVLLEAGYRCANPVCRYPLTLHMHHIEYVSEGGTNDAWNILVLRTRCHEEHHREQLIPRSAIRAWKQLLMTLNAAFDRRAVDILLALHKLGRVWMSGDGFVHCAPLIASGLVDFEQVGKGSWSPELPNPPCSVCLSPRGSGFVEAWKAGDQKKARLAAPLKTSQSQAEGTIVMFQLLIAIALIFASLGTWIAIQRNRSAGGGFILGLLFGPLGALVELFLPPGDRTVTTPTRRNIDDLGTIASIAERFRTALDELDPNWERLPYH
jgi:hypothetical protein